MLRPRPQACAVRRGGWEVRSRRESRKTQTEDGELLPGDQTPRRIGKGSWSSCFSKFLLTFLGWQWLVKLYRSQGHDPVPRRLYTAVCSPPQVGSPTAPLALHPEGCRTFLPHRVILEESIITTCFEH